MRVRDKLEHIIDVLHAPLKRREKKPRTYRRNARRDYLNVAKKKRASRAEIRKAMGKQLRYVKRDLAHIEDLKERIPSRFSEEEESPRSAGHQ